MHRPGREDPHRLERNLLSVQSQKKHTLHLGLSGKSWEVYEETYGWCYIHVHKKMSTEVIGGPSDWVWTPADTEIEDPN